MTKSRTPTSPLLGAAIFLLVCNAGAQVPTETPTPQKPPSEAPPSAGSDAPKSNTDKATSEQPHQAESTKDEEAPPSSDTLASGNPPDSQATPEDAPTKEPASPMQGETAAGGAPAVDAPAKQTAPLPASKASSTKKTEGSTKQKESPAPEKIELDDGGYHGASDKNLVPKEKPLPKMSFDVMLDLTIPFGKTADFVSNVGLQGFAVSFRYYLTQQLAVGVGAAFDGLSQKKDGTTAYDELVITGTHTKQLSFTPLLAKAFYAFHRGEKLEPYVALGAGAALASRRLVTGYSAFSDSQWHLAAVPEIGVHLDIGQLVLLGAARMTFLPPSKGADTQTFANVSLGVAIQ